MAAITITPLHQIGCQWELQHACSCTVRGMLCLLGVRVHKPTLAGYLPVVQVKHFPFVCIVELGREKNNYAANGVQICQPKYLFHLSSCVSNSCWPHGLRYGVAGTRNTLHYAAPTSVPVHSSIGLFLQFAVQVARRTTKIILAQ